MTLKQQREAEHLLKEAMSHICAATIQLAEISEIFEDCGDIRNQRAFEEVYCKLRDFHNNQVFPFSENPIWNAHLCR